MERKLKEITNRLMILSPHNKLLITEFEVSIKWILNTRI